MTSVGFSGAGAGGVPGRGQLPPTTYAGERQPNTSQDSPDRGVQTKPRQLVAHTGNRAPSLRLPPLRDRGQLSFSETQHHSRSNRVSLFPLEYT